MYVVALGVAPILHKTEISGYGPPLSRGRRNEVERATMPHGHRFRKFQARKNLFRETTPSTSRSSAQQRRGRITQSNRRRCPIAGGGPPPRQSIGRPSTSKPLALISAVAFGA